MVGVAQLLDLHLRPGHEVGNREIRLRVAQLGPVRAGPRPACSAQRSLTCPVLVESAAHDIALAVAVGDEVGPVLQAAELLLEVHLPGPDRKLADVRLCPMGIPVAPKLRDLIDQLEVVLHRLTSSASRSGSNRHASRGMLATGRQGASGTGKGAAAVGPAVAAPSGPRPGPAPGRRGAPNRPGTPPPVRGGAERRGCPRGLAAGAAEYYDRAGRSTKMVAEIVRQDRTVTGRRGGRGRAARRTAPRCG